MDCGIEVSSSKKVKLNTTQKTKKITRKNVTPTSYDKILLSKAETKRKPLFPITKPNVNKALTLAHS